MSETQRMKLVTELHGAVRTVQLRHVPETFDDDICCILTVFLEKPGQQMF